MPTNPPQSLEQATEYEKGYYEGYKAGSGGIVADVMRLKEQFEDGWKRGRLDLLQQITERVSGIGGMWVTQREPGKRGKKRKLIEVDELLELLNSLKEE